MPVRPVLAGWGGHPMIRSPDLSRPAMDDQITRSRGVTLNVVSPSVIDASREAPAKRET
jgi:hypothetical protein